MVSAHGISKNDRLMSDLCERRKVFANIVRHWMDRSFETPSRYLKYQVSRLLAKVNEGGTATVVDCSRHGLSTQLLERARAQRWCLCQFCSQWKSSGDFPYPENDMTQPPPSEPPLLDTAILRVCKEMYAIAKDLVWENVFHFDKQSDMERFLPMLGDRQRAKMKKVQIAKEVVLLL